MLSRFSLAFSTLLLTALLAFAWALLLFYTNPPLRPENVDWPRTLRDLSLCLAAFLLFATAAYLPVRRPIASKLTIGFGLNFVGVWQALINDLVEPHGWLTEAISFLCIPVGLLIAALGLYQLGRAYRMNRLILGSYQQIERDLATVDQLTQLYNRRYFFATCAPLLEQALAAGQQPVVIGLRVLNLTELNQKLGLEAGDDILRRVGKAVRRYLRPGQIAARMGGRRFALFLPDGTEHEAEDLVKQIATRLENLLMTDERGDETLIHVQIDHQIAVAGEDDTLETLVRRTSASESDTGKNRHPE
ncbi:GGDEF domain-containing protein [Marinimicrobium sp. C6131]|uniref:GGDEF domain-containing protein n=1 Tax=Marinimicrobium sp. C6131 TaxID=3022676 RepID=UPI00223CE460|nr:GGDEF domain-containing protein [Marinimicrobium sp. C6131]UZJ43191.1 GGDEF domain-containing protein [Marinimicrobium sp. C6131]